MRSGKAALERLIQIAQGDTGQSRIVANFLLAWWNAAECGGFDLTDVWVVDTAIAVDMLRVFALLAGGQHYPGCAGIPRTLRSYRPRLAADRRSQREDRNAMIEEMATVRITEAELARDIHAVLAKVQEGVEEQDHRPVAVIKTPQRPGRKISACIALAKAYEEKLGYAPVPDADFAKDVQAAIDAHREPLNPPAWD
jgi:hypothetical protein